MTTSGNPGPEASHSLIDSFLRLLIRKGTRAFVTRAAGSVTTFLAHLLLARLMGVTEYGLFAYTYAWIVFLGLTAKWGLDKLVVRFGSPYAAGQRVGEFNAVFRFALRRGLAVATALAAATLAIVTALGSRLEENMTDCLMLAVVWLPLITVQRIHEGAAESLRNIFQATVPDYIVRPALLGGLALLHYLLTRQAPTAREVVNYYSLSLALTVLLHHVWFIRVWQARVTPATPLLPQPDWIPFATHMTLINNLSYAVSQADVLVIGVLLSTTDAGIYSIASRIANVAIFVSTAALMVFAPAVAELHARDARDELQQKAVHLRRRVVGFTLLVAAGLGASGPWVLAAFGESFTAAILPLWVLLAGYTLRAFFSVSEALLNMSGHQLTTLRVMAICAALNVALNVLLLYVIGTPTAAAIATVASTVVMYFVLDREANRRLFKGLLHGES